MPSKLTIQHYRDGEMRFEPGEHFDFACSPTWQDFYADPGGRTRRPDADESRSDEVRRLVRDELARERLEADARETHDYALFGRWQGEPPPPEDAPEAAPPAQGRPRTSAARPNTRPTSPTTPEPKRQHLSLEAARKLKREQLLDPLADLMA